MRLEIVQTSLGRINKYRKVIRVFISSAGDTIKERNEAVDVIANHNRHHQKQGYILEATRYESHVPPSQGHPQKIIDNSAGLAGDHDVAIYIFRERIGEGTLSELKSGLESKSCRAMIYCYATDSDQVPMVDLGKYFPKKNFLRSKFYPIEDGGKTNFSDLLSGHLINLAIEKRCWIEREDVKRQELIDRVYQYWFKDNTWRDHENPVPVLVKINGLYADFNTATTEALTASGPTRLVVVGEQGSGKSFALHQLLKKQHESAIDNARIPFYVSAVSWLLGGRKPFAKWLENELHMAYKIKRKSAEELIDDDLVIPVVDGLDEIMGNDSTLPNEFVDAFLYWIHDRPIIAACNSAIWERTVDQFPKLKEIVRLSLHDHDDMCGLFADREDVLELVEKNAKLKAFARVPLHASLLRNLVNIGDDQRRLLLNFSDTIEERRRLVEMAIDWRVRFSTIDNGNQVSPRHLTILAKALKPGESFQTDRIQPEQFPSAFVTYKILSSCSTGLLVFLLVLFCSAPGLFVERCLADVAYPRAFADSVSIAAKGAFAGAITIALGMLATRNWFSFAIFVGVSFSIARGIVVGARFSDLYLPIFIIFWCIAFKIAALSPTRISPVEATIGSLRSLSRKAFKWALPTSLAIAVAFGVSSDLARGVAFGLLAFIAVFLVFVLSTTTPQRHISINSGIKMSIRNALMAGGLGVATGSISLGISYSLISWEQGIVNALLGLNLILLSLLCGAVAVTQHYSLRGALWWHRMLPFLLPSWCQGAVRAGVLKQAGNQFSFVHETWRSYYERRHY